MKIKKLSAMPYAQAHVEVGDNTVYLFSYSTLVISLTNDGWLRCYGLHTMTTKKHIGAFMKEYVRYPNGRTGTYQDAKGAFNGHYMLNIKTGEVVNL